MTSNTSQSQGDYQNFSDDGEQNFQNYNEVSTSDNENGGQDLASTLKDVSKIIKGVQKITNQFNNDNTAQNEYYNEDEYNDGGNNR